jgi:hypothetical protein
MVTGNIDMKNMVVLSPPRKLAGGGGGLENKKSKIIKIFKFNILV